MSIELLSNTAIQVFHGEALPEVHKVISST